MDWLKLGKNLAAKGLKVLGKTIPFGTDVANLVVEELGLESEKEIEKIAATEQGLQKLKQFEKDYELKLHQLCLKDIQSARMREVEVNKAKNASWLTKNISALIALLVTILAIIIYVFVLAGELKTTDATVSQVIQSITNLLLVILSFYFGSSMVKQK